MVKKITIPVLKGCTWAHDENSMSQFLSRPAVALMCLTILSEPAQFRE